MENDPLKSERVKKFLEKFYPTKVDKLGLPSIITVNDKGRITSAANATINLSTFATTGKAIAMAIVFGG